MCDATLVIADEVAQITHWEGERFCEYIDAPMVRVSFNSFEVPLFSIPATRRLFVNDSGVYTIDGTGRVLFRYRPELSARRTAADRRRTWSLAMGALYFIVIGLLIVILVTKTTIRTMKS